MRNPFAMLLTFVPAFGLFAAAASAQTNPNLETGLKPYGSYEGGNIDSVSLTNGNLTLHIPLFSYPQRGSIPADINLSYNNKNWYVYQHCQNGACTDQWRWNLRSLNGVYFNADGGVGVYFAPLPPLNQTYLYTAYTSDGGSHQMVPDNAGGYHTVDGTGIWYAGGNGLNGLPTTVLTRDGSQPLTIDPNGNLATSFNPAQNNPSAGVQTDTLGRNLTGSSTNTTDYAGCIQPAAPNQINQADIWTIPGTNRMVKSCSATYSLQTNFQQFDSNAGVPIQEGSYSASFLVSVVLYNGSSWSTSPAWGFDYQDSYGDLTKITLPTGGTISYAWEIASMCTGVNALTQVSMAVGARTVDAHDGSGAHTWTYAMNSALPSGSGSTWGTIVTDHRNNQTVHAMTEYGQCGYYEIQTNYFQGSATSGSLLKTVKTDYTWTQNPYAGLNPSPPVNVFPIRTTTIWPNGKTTKLEKDYDSDFHSPTGTFSYGEVVAVREFDYGTNAPGPLLRTTTSTYLAASSSAYLAANLLDLVSGTTITDGGGAQVAQTTYAYDGFTLQSGGITTQRNSAFNTTSPGTRGNRTSICRWLNTTGGTLCTTTKYYDTGMPYQTTDPKGNTTTLSFSSAYAGAYLTQTNLPDTNSPNLAHHVASGTYDFNTGELLSVTDQNSKTSNYAYDSLGRITSASFPDSGLTNFTYTDTPLSAHVERTQKITSSVSTDLLVYFDGLARQTQTQLKSDPSGTVYTDYTYDGQDGFLRVDSVSNPYRTKSDSTYGITTTESDSLGRATLLIPPDGTKTANNVSTLYCANSTLVTDQSGHWRRSTSDGLGRLVEVDEPNSLTATVNVCPGTGEPIWPTTYTYDGLNNLKTVVQNGSRNRSFLYDSLSRLTSATNPESGTASYSYDGNGNVISKTDARNISTTYAYDPLNRLNGKSYSDSTAPVTFLFDGAAPTGAGAPGTGSIAIGGAEQSFLQDCPNPPCHYTYDTGTITITVNGHSDSVNYGAGSNSTNLAYLLTNAINADGMAFVTATYSGSTVTVTAKSSGANTNYSLSASAVTNDPNDFPTGSYTTSTSGANLTGGSAGCDTKGITLAPANGIGRRTGMCDAAGSEAWSYDVMGRSVADQRSINTVSKSTAYTYNLDGSIATLTYPSGRVITYTTDSAGRPSLAQDVPNSVNYALGPCANGVGTTGACYAPQGGLATMQNGSTLYSTYLYNNRLQPCWLYTTTTSVGGPASCTQTGVANAAILDYQFNFGLGLADNGNVNAITNRRDNTRSQSFTYDQVSRLATAQTQTTGVTIPNSNCWGLTFTYDSWGNLLQASTTGPAGCGEPAPLNVTATAANQISGYCYDAAGNLLDAGTCPTGSNPHAYVYNAENQLTSTAGGMYTYDGDGKRVQKSNGKLYWYGMGSDPLDETDLQGNTNNSSFFEYVFFGGIRIARRDSANNVNYYFSDHLGTARIVTNAAGAILDNSDFYPFGGERPVTSSSGNHYKFTGKERDSESGLDNFGARYNSSSFGRFTSPDPMMASAKVWDPQTWNRYSYARNNPLLFIDPTGMKEVTAEQCAKDKNCVTVKVNVIYDQNSNSGKGLTDQQKADFEKQQLQNARDQYGNADIHLDVTYTAGSMTLNDKGASFTGLQEGALNVVVTDQVTRADSGMQGRTALSLIPANSTDKEDLPHEMAHQFMGQTQGWMGWLKIHEPNFSGDIMNRLLDASNNVERAWMRTFDRHSGPFSYYPLASAFHGNAADFQKFIQPTTKPQ